MFDWIRVLDMARCMGAEDLIPSADKTTNKIVFHLYPWQYSVTNLKANFYKCKSNKKSFSATHKYSPLDVFHILFNEAT